CCFVTEGAAVAIPHLLNEYLGAPPHGPWDQVPGRAPPSASSALGSGANRAAHREHPSVPESTLSDRFDEDLHSLIPQQLSLKCPLHLVQGEPMRYQRSGADTPRTNHVDGLREILAAVCKCAEKSHLLLDDHGRIDGHGLVVQGGRGKLASVSYHLDRLQKHL